MNPFHRSLLAVVTLAVIALAQTLPLSAAPPAGDHAAFTSQTTPAALLAGHTNLVTVRMVNRGTTTWRAADQYFLGSINPADNLIWGFNRVSLSAAVAPGQTAAFHFEIVAPLVPGGYDLQWQMTREGRGFFGQPSSNASIAVLLPVNPGNAAAFDSQIVPTFMTTGGTALASITLRNTGTTTWTEATRHRLGSFNPVDNANWNIRRVFLRNSVPPGASYTFTFSIRAPSTPGSYSFQWMMVQEAVGRFEQRTPNVVIQVSATAARPPLFTQQPTNKTVVAGATAEFTAAASGTPPPTLRWQSKVPGALDFTNIVGAIAGTYVTPVLLPADTGTQFRCVATNASGSATSAVATVTVTVPGIAPSFTQQPTNKTVVAGTTAEFTAAASGTPSPTLRWQSKVPGALDFTNIVGAIAGTYVTPVLLAADNGTQFQCVATNASGTATSAVATVTVTVPGIAPSFTQQPTNKTVVAGTTVELTTVASGTPPPSLLWQSKVPGALDFTNISGAIAGTFVTPVLLPADNGTQFRCVATNSSGSATSAVATVTVTVIGSAPSFTQQPISKTVVAGNTAELSAVASGTPAPTFRWQSKVPGATDFTNIAGAIAGTYVTPVLLPADNGTQFRCVATNSSGSATSAVATVTVFGIAPGFTQPPTNVSVFEGQTASFTATASGAPPPTLQWQIKAPAAGQFTDISGATATTYVTPILALADHNSQFRCRASNAAGTATSAIATLTVSNTPRGFNRIHPKMELQTGDTVVFLGDSITYQALYTQYFEDFFYTRFPNRRIHFRNAGVANDRATNALVRFDDDVAAFRPKYVTLLLGMNDGGYRDFDKPIFDTYQRNISTLFDRIAQLGAIAVPITPTMYDGRAARLRHSPSEPRDTHYNGVLGLYGAWLRESAYTRGLGFADVYSPLNHATTAGRKMDALFTLIPDAVHPDAPGHVIMAVALIEDLGLRSPVSSILIQENAGQFTAAADNGQITNFTTGDRISFTFTANALPWVLPAEARLGFQLTRAGSNFSPEKFTAQNLPAGTYELRIDATPVGTYSDGQLAAGLELQENELTPQFQQALRVAQFNKDKNATAVRPLRKWWEQLRDKRLELDKAIADQDPNLPAKRAAFAAWLTTFQAGVAALQSLVTTYEDQIYQANQPPPRRYELLRVPAAARAR